MVPLVSPDAKFPPHPARHGLSAKYVDERPVPDAERLATPQMTRGDLGENGGDDKGWGVPFPLPHAGGEYLVLTALWFAL